MNYDRLEMHLEQSIEAFTQLDISERKRLTTILLSHIKSECDKKEKVRKFRFSNITDINPGQEIKDERR